MRKKENKLNEYINKLRVLIQKPIFLKAAIAVGILMIILILISDFSANNTSKTKADESTIDFNISNIYTDETEAKLCGMLSSIEGVGKAQVMITINSTEEYVYAETLKKGTSQSENSYVILDKGSKKEALIKKINNPTIGGVIIVCEGGDDPRICEKIYKAVSTALDISTGKIYVTEMK